MMNEYFNDDHFEYGTGEYFSQEDFFGNHTASYLASDIDDLDLECELSSPTPMRTLGPHQGRPYLNQTAQSSMVQCGPYSDPRAFGTSRNDGVVLDRSRIGQSTGEYRQGNPSSISRDNGLATNGIEWDTPNGIKLRPVSDLPDKYRSFFKFGVFNAVQSSCFSDVFTSSKNLVISAPTGSGKTVIFELAMIRTLEMSVQCGKPAKCIYVAPTKALCMEKFQDWTTKFEPLGFKCAQLTGDTVVFGSDTWGAAKDSSVIVTTCEKWDSLTRNWNDYDHILSKIELFLVDEIHILNEMRGSTLEVVTSRMKLKRPTSRFILVSATVPNIRDVAEWIGIGAGSQAPAVVFEFGDDYRPCKLTRHVVGIPRKNSMNEFQFAKSLDYKLFSTIVQFTRRKPILVFCPTRKGVFGTAEQLMKEYIDNEAKQMTMPWSRPANTRLNHLFSDKRLDEFATVGIGVHHAGLTLDDRRATEKLYLDKVLRVLIATSTLAVGVNLPAHMVIIKGVFTYQNNATKEYSDLDVMQMLGRAGRPQFDIDGIAVIMCESQLEAKYKALVQGRTVLESSLHLNLLEHLNSEIGLGTITSVSLAREWLYSSFLFQRIKHNPGHYTTTTTEIDSTTVGDELILRSIEQLKQTQLVEAVDNVKGSDDLRCTDFGDIMSKFYIRRATMQQILNLHEHATLRDMLETICCAEEFSDCKLRASEKAVYNKLRRDIDIRFEIKKIDKTSDKVFVLVQAVLAGISLNSPEYKTTESQPYLEAFAVFKHIVRIARAVLAVVVIKRQGAQIKNGLELLRCLTAKAWEDRAIVLRQIEHLGEKSIKVLAEHGITSLTLLRKQDPLRIEKLLNRRPPFGLEVLASVSDLPQYNLSVQEVDVKSGCGKPVEVCLRIDCRLLEAEHRTSKHKKPHNLKFDRTSVLTITSDMDFIDFRRIPSKSLLGGKSFELDFELKKPSQTVMVIITSENVAGVACQHTYKPNVPSGAYPVPNTRPVSSMDMDLMGLENDPDFWITTLDSDSPKRGFPDAMKDDSLDALPDQMRIKLDSNNPPDGLYECNHACKDKTSCRHLCCRDGVPHPPTSKKHSQPPRKPASNVKQRTKSQKIHAAKKPKDDKNFTQMKVTHERASAVNDFSVPDRLKIESTSSKRRNRPLVDYNINFTDLKEPNGNLSLGDFPDSLSDEDLPTSIVPADDSHQNLPLNKRKSENQYDDHANDSRHPSKLRKKSHLTSTITIDSPRPLFVLSDSSDNNDTIRISSPVLSCDERSVLKKDVVGTSSNLHDLTVQQAKERQVAETTTSTDAFAELEAWLESGTFEVV